MIGLPKKPAKDESISLMGIWLSSWHSSLQKGNACPLINEDKGKPKALILVEAIEKGLQWFVVGLYGFLDVFGVEDIV